MTPQELADELARLAGWRQTNYEAWHGSGGVLPVGSHPFPIGSLDDLEAFRREKLPGWEWSTIDRMGNGDWIATMWCPSRPTTGARGKGLHPDEWTARASALVEAARENNP